MITAAQYCLALNVYHEARSESMAGQYAVAQVVINRVHSDSFPDTICGVVKQGYHKGRHRCQFSWHCDGKSDKPRNSVSWATSVVVANNVMRNRVPDITNGATHYHANYVNPYWAKHLDKTVTIGTHLFYK